MVSAGAIGAIDTGRIPGTAALALAVVALPLLLVFLFRRGLAPVPLAGIGLAALIALAVLGRMAQTDYLDERYSSTAPDYPRTEQPAIELDQGLGSAYDWAQGARGLRVGLSGTTGALFQYGLWGGDSSNEVTYIGRQGAAGSFNEIAECPEWIAALNDGDYDYVITTPTYHQDDPAADTAPAAARLDLARRQRAARRRRGPRRRLADHGPLDPRRAPPSPPELLPARRFRRCYQVGGGLSARQRALPVGGGRPPPPRARGGAPAARTAARAVDAIRDELRRRIGPTFTARAGRPLRPRHRLVPRGGAGPRRAEAAVDLDPQAIVDGAFFLYLRGARTTRRPGHRRTG